MIEPPDHPLGDLDGVALFVVGGQKLLDEALGVDPAERVIADAELADVVGSADGVIGEMDCFYASWMTDRADGFTDDEIAALLRLTPFLGLAIKATSLGRIAETLVETYLGRDAGRRVLSGRIARGVADRNSGPAAVFSPEGKLA